MRRALIQFLPLPTTHRSWWFTPARGAAYRYHPRMEDVLRQKRAAALKRQINRYRTL